MPNETSSQVGLRRLAGLGLTAAAGRALVEFYARAPQSGDWIGKLSLKWGLGFIGVGLLTLAALAVCWLALLRPARLAGLEARLVARRARLGKLRWGLAALAALLPAILLIYTPLGDLLDAPFLRLAALLAAAGPLAFLICSDEQRLFRPAAFLAALLAVASLHILAERLSGVSAYPFSLGWSEGNRLYNFSVRVDPGRYVIPDASGLRRSAPGRNFLWGLLFFLPHTPIWLHRLWDAVLWTVPYLAFGWSLGRFAGLSKRWLWLFSLWVFVFLFQGPIYTPLILSALLVGLATRPGRWLAAAIAAPLADFYAAASRWTWLPGPAAWSTLLLLADFKTRKGESLGRLVARLLPVGLIAALGLAGGALANDRLFSPKELKSSTALAQPLLWYRLFPNVNYPEGILFGLLIAALPLTALLLWLALSKRWAVNWVQAAAYLASGLVFLGGGLVASVKIGGGNNLHNLDMFLITLAVLAAIAIRQLGPGGGARPWPGWAQAALLLACLLPAWNAVRLGGPLDLPAQKATSAALQTLQTRLSKAQKRGAVLFIDQRQLLTFGDIQGISLIPDYEKKYMMDKAMAGDAAYFQQFYADLAAKRFSMIVSEPLFANVQDMTSGFQEENNAWVQWVARPLLCYYAPVETLSEARTQLLVPRENPQGCP